MVIRQEAMFRQRHHPEEGKRILNLPAEKTCCIKNVHQHSLPASMPAQKRKLFADFGLMSCNTRLARHKISDNPEIRVKKMCTYNMYQPDCWWLTQQCRFCFRLNRTAP